MNRQNAEFQDSENTLYDAIMMDICRYIVVQTHRIHNIMREPYFICYGFGVIVKVNEKVHQLLVNVQLRREFLIVRRLGMGEGKECTKSSYHPVQLFVNLKLL